MTDTDEVGTARQLLVCGAVLALSLLLALLASAQPRPGERVAVFFAPWVSQTEAASRVWRAGGFFLAEGRVPGAVLALGDAPDFLNRLSDGGAYFALDATLAGVLCRPAGPSTYAQASFELDDKHAETG